jgi:voltage-gated potassium channel
VSLRRRFAQIVLLVVAVVSFGTAGYVLIEGFSLFDALYLTVITVASVGYGEIPRELTTAGRAFTMVLIVGGLGTMAYALSAMTAFFVEGDIAHAWERRRMERRIAKLQGHVVVCGGGQTGRHIARELVATRSHFVVIERSPAETEALGRLGEVLYLVGDATDTEVLLRARIDRAAGLITCMPSDKDNLFTILSARELNPSMRIVSRLIEDDTRPKLTRAGADAVVSVPTIGALRLASEMLRPHVVSVLDAMLREPGSVRVQEIPVGPSAAGRTLGDLELDERVGIRVFAMRDAATRRHRFNPPSTYVLAEGDVLFACTDPDQLREARRLVTDG